MSMLMYSLVLLVFDAWKSGLANILMVSLELIQWKWWLSIDSDQSIQIYRVGVVDSNQRFYVS